MIEVSREQLKRDRKYWDEVYAYRELTNLQQQLDYQIARTGLTNGFHAQGLEKLSKRNRDLAHLRALELID